MRSIYNIHEASKCCACARLRISMNSWILKCDFDEQHTEIPTLQTSQNVHTAQCKHKKETISHSSWRCCCCCCSHLVLRHLGCCIFCGNYLSALLNFITNRWYRNPSGINENHSKIHTSSLNRTLLFLLHNMSKTPTENTLQRLMWIYFWKCIKSANQPFIQKKRNMMKK